MQLHIVIYSELKKWQGGRERWLGYFLRGVHSKYSKVNVYFLRKEGNVDQKERFIYDDFHNFENIYWYPVTASTWSKWVFRTLVRSITLVKPGEHVVSVGSGPEAIVGICLKILRKVQFIIWLRTVLKAELSGRKGRFFVKFAEIVERLGLRLADKVIANGYDTMLYYKRTTRKPIHVVPNAIDNFNELSAVPLPMFHIPITIAFLGRFVKERGSEYFLRLCHGVRDDPRFRFVVYGPTYDGDQNPGGQNLIFKGPYYPEELPNILKTADVVTFLLPSVGVHGGGVSHALLETMASGRLIIAWKNPIVLSNNLLTDSNSILVDEGDLDKIIHILDEICRSPESFIDKCIQARRDSQRFSAVNHVEMFLRIVGMS